MFCAPVQGAVADAHAAEAAAKEASAEAEQQMQRIAERDAQHAEVTTNVCAPSHGSFARGLAVHATVSFHLLQHASQSAHIAGLCVPVLPGNHVMLTV
jgi:hypothetical protein